MIDQKTQAADKIRAALLELERQPTVKEYYLMSDGERWQALIFQGVVLSFKTAVVFLYKSLEDMEYKARKISENLSRM